MEGLGLHHEFLLCALHDVTGTSDISGAYDTYGLGGAFVAEMQVRDRLVAVRANVFALRAGELSPGALGMAEHRLGGAQLGMKDCISTVTESFFQTVAPLRRAALEELVELGALTRTQDTFLFIPWRMRYPEADPAVEDAIRARLRAHITTVDDGDAPGRDDLLLSLLRCAKLLTGVWTETELEALRPAIEERTRRAPIGLVVRELVTDAETAAAIAASSVAAL